MAFPIGFSKLFNKSVFVFALAYANFSFNVMPAFSDDTLVRKGEKELVAWYSCFGNGVPFYCRTRICLKFRYKSNGQPARVHLYRDAMLLEKDLDFHVGAACVVTKGFSYRLFVRATDGDTIVTAHDQFTK